MMSDYEYMALRAIFDVENELRQIFENNISYFLETNNFKIRLDDGEKYYLDKMDVTYEHSLIALIHTILLDKGHLQFLLPENIYSEMGNFKDWTWTFLEFIHTDGDYQLDDKCKFTYIEMFEIITECLVFLTARIFKQYDFNDAVKDFEPFEVSDGLCVDVTFSWGGD